MSEETLKRRVEGSLKATAIMGLLDNAEIEDADFMDGFLCKLQREFGQDEIDTNVPPTVTPIARLGQTVMPFGGHKGKTFDDTPLEYLDWLCRSQEDFYKDLRAYLKHPEIGQWRG